MRIPETTILDIARTFPCLRTKLADWTSFDPDLLAELSDKWSSGERLCVLVVLNIWNPGYAKRKGWTFNLFDFVGTADAANSAALVEWIRKPIWP